MALGNPMIKTNLDPDTTDPKQGRDDLVQNVDQYNVTLTHLGNSVLLNQNDPATVGHGLELNMNALRVALQATPGIQRTSGGIALDIPSLTQEVTPDVADFFAMNKTAGALRRKATLADLLKIINGLTEETDPNLDNDYVAVYSAAGMAARKVTLQNIGGGGWQFAADFTAGGTATTLDISSAVDAAYGAYEIFLNELQPTTTQAEITLEVQTSSGWETGTDYAGYYKVYTSSSVAVSTPTSANNVAISGGQTVAAAAASGLVGPITVRDTADPNWPTSVDWRCNFIRQTGGGQQRAAEGVVRFTAARAVTGMRFVSAGGNLTGSVRVRRQPYAYQ